MQHKSKQKGKKTNFCDAIVISKLNLKKEVARPGNLRYVFLVAWRPIKLVAWGDWAMQEHSFDNVFIVHQFFSFTCLFKNHIELLSTFLDESRESQM